MATFTSSLPEDLLNELNEKAQNLSIAKNKIIEKALRIYLDQLNKAEYIKSYKAAGQDDDIMNIAEEGMAEYIQQIEAES